jgi:hypothetical protein
MTFLPDTNHITRTDQVRRNIDFPVVDKKMTVSDKMATLGTRIHKTEPVNHIIQPAFQHHQKIRTGNSLLPFRPFKEQTELFFGNTVHAFYLLFFPKLNPVIRNFSPAALTVLARGIAPPVKGTFVRIAPVSLQE